MEPDDVFITPLGNGRTSRLEVDKSTGLIWHTVTGADGELGTSKVMTAEDARRYMEALAEAVRLATAEDPPPES